MEVLHYNTSLQKNMTMYLDAMVTEFNDVEYSTLSNINGSDPDALTNMMDTPYGKRLVPYTIISSCCIIFNVLSLLAMARIRTHRTVHHVLLLNLAVCDIVGSALLWMYYNSPVLFPRFRVSTLEHCLFITVVIVAPFILSLCNSLCSLLMLALNQYVAICDPIFSTTKMTKTKVRGSIAIAWLLSAMLASIPALAMLFMSRNDPCSDYVRNVGQKSVEVCAYAMAALIIIIVGLYGRIYRVVIGYRRSAPHVRRNRTTLGGGLEAETNYKAFVTTLLLTGNLVLFWLPYMVFHFISAHVDIDLIPDSVLNIKFYFMDFLPMLNFITDPIIYGIRMREIRLGYHRLFAKIMPCCVKEPRRPNFSRTTIRFSTLDPESTVL